MGQCPFNHSNTDTEVDGDGPRSGGSHGGDGGDSSRGSGIDRRSFVKSALLIGGAAAVSSLSGCTSVTTTLRPGESDPITARERLNRQHNWDDYEHFVKTGNTVHPPNAIILLMDYAHEGEPAPAHRRQVATALRELERAFEWDEAGLLFTIAYSAKYFDRFEQDPPPGAAPDPQATVATKVEALTELADTNTGITPDEYDVCLLLSSENEANLLAAEAALWGDDNELAISLVETFEGVFERPTSWPERRVGFGGPEFQAREETYEEEFLDGEDAIPDEAPLSMGHIAGFGGSIPQEDVVTLKRDQRFPGADVPEDAVPDLEYIEGTGDRNPGVFAQGTLKHLSHLTIDLEAWYGETGGADEPSGTAQRRHQMYSPYHTAAETNAKGGAKPGSGLVGDENTPGDGPAQDQLGVREYADRTPQTASGDDAAETSVPTAAHSQKSARARYDIDGDGAPEQPVLRRDWDQLIPVGQADEDKAGYIFNVPMRFNESIYSLLDASYNIGFTSLDGEIDHEGVAPDAAVKDRNGIAPYMDAVRRGNWLVPPITVRALPYPRAASATLTVTHAENAYEVTISDLSADERVDPETIRFGTPEHVDKAGGMTPEEVSQTSETIRFEVPIDAVDVMDEAKVFAKYSKTRKPLSATASIK